MAMEERSPGDLQKPRGGIWLPPLPFGIGRREHEGVPTTLRDRNPELWRYSKRLVGFFRALNEMEGKKRGLIDFDLAPPDPTVEEFHALIIDPDSKSEKLKALSRLTNYQNQLSDIEEPQDSADQQQYDFLKAKMVAHITFLEVKLGAQYPFEEYIERTQGFTPQWISEYRLRAQLEVVQKAFEAAGGGSFDKASTEEYQGKHKVPETEIGQRIRENGDLMLQELGLFLGADQDVKYAVEVVEENAYWINWATGTAQEKVLKINNHRRHNGRWTDGKVEEMPQHEIVGHMAQMTSWQRAIENGELLPVLGLTSVHDPEQLTSEGVALAMLEFVPRINFKLSAHGEFEHELSALRHMVYNNVHIWVNVSDPPLEEIIDYIRFFLPAETRDEIERQVKERKGDDQKRSYLMAYGYGYFLHSEYANALNEVGKKELLKYIFSSPCTPEQEYKFFKALREDPQRRFASAYAPFEDGEPKFSKLGEKPPRDLTLTY